MYRKANRKSQKLSALLKDGRKSTKDVQSHALTLIHSLCEQDVSKTVCARALDFYRNYATVVLEML